MTSVAELRALEESGVALNELGRERLKAADQREDEAEAQREAERAAANKALGAAGKRQAASQPKALAAMQACIEAMEEATRDANAYRAAMRRARALGVAPSDPIESTASLCARADGAELRKLFRDFASTARGDF